MCEACCERDGCIAYDVAVDAFDPGVIRFSELWPDRETLERHFSAPHIAPWRAASKQHGLLSREFTAYIVQDEFAV
jgi:quinol monooxygenase YgiN